ncbi:DNA recombination protein RmuC [Erysipelothrix sp. HDW6C]|nr:DNA recombination protein RmuC [Erysipelothrix sp. HDW6C]
MDLVLVLLAVIMIVLVIILIKLFSNRTPEAVHEFNQSLNRQSIDNREHLNTQFNTFTDRMDLRIKDLHDRNTNFEKATATSLIQFQDKLGSSMELQFDRLQATVERRLAMMDQKVTENLEEGFKKTNATFTNIVERLSKIDEAQKKIDALSVEIVSLQDVLTDKKTRGTFGEVQLSQIMAAIFGDRNDKIYQMQYTFQTGVRSDAVLFAPEPLGTIAIDSKFPLENYRRMMDKDISDIERAQAERTFVSDCKKHIDAIADKYIIPGVTSDQAIMFIPAEAIFATINAYHQDIIDYSQKRRVWLASPTTLMSTLTTIQTILVNLEREKYASVIHQELRLLSSEFDRYRERWEGLSRRMEGVNEEFRKINITTEKITKRFDAIANVEHIEEQTNDAS